jgi:hypothetical protein
LRFDDDARRVSRRCFGVCAGEIHTGGVAKLIWEIGQQVREQLAATALGTQQASERNERRRGRRFRRHNSDCSCEAGQSSELLLAALALVIRFDNIEPVTML